MNKKLNGNEEIEFPTGVDPKHMSEKEFEGFLSDALEEYMSQNHEMGEIRFDTRTYKEAGLLTLNRGIVFSIGDTEFQILIVRSR